MGAEIGIGIGIGLGINAAGSAGGGGVAIPPLPVSGLIAAWDFTLAEASPIPNLVAAGTAMTIPAATNNPTVSAAGLVFDGVDDYASSDLYPLSAGGTLLCVAKTARSFPSDTGATAYRGLMGKTSGGNAATIAYVLYWTGGNVDGYIQLLIANGAAFNGATPLVQFSNFANVYHCLGAKWNGALASVWIDGTKRNQQTQTVNANASLATPFKLSQLFGATANSWSGQIAFACIYNRGLSDAEMLVAYNAIKARLAPRGVAT